MSIRVHEYQNTKCIKCKRVCRNMVRIGVIHMCLKCKKEEFGNQELIDMMSITGINYYKWLGVYKETDD